MLTLPLYERCYHVDDCDTCLIGGWHIVYQNGNTKHPNGMITASPSTVMRVEGGPNAPWHADPRAEMQS